MGHFNASPRPATVPITGDRAAIICRRDPEEDVLRRDCGGFAPPRSLSDSQALSGKAFDSGLRGGYALHE